MYGAAVAAEPARYAPRGAMTAQPAFKVLITDYGWPTLEPEQAVLEPVGAELVAADSPDEARLTELAADCDAIMTNWAQVPVAAVRASPKLKIIARYGVGVDNIPVDVATEQGIPVTNVPDYCVEEVANHAMALLLSLARGLFKLDHGTRTGGWSFAAAQPLWRLSAQRLGILGYGRNGRAVAQRARAFGFDIVVHDPYIEASQFPAHERPNLVGLEELLRSSDLVSVHTPLTDATHHMLGADQFQMMKNTAYVVNTGRGPVIDEAALVEALKAGQLAGAGLDVYETEPLPADHPLLDLPNVILTSHAAFYSEGSLAELQRRTAENVALVLQGHIPHNVMNPEVLERTGLKPQAS
jgi:D-3-phosphoglycerate dehydrogenase